MIVTVIKINGNFKSNKKLQVAYNYAHAQESFMVYLK